MLSEYGWPGNVRELRSVINKAIIFANSGPIMPEHLPASILANRRTVSRQPQTLEELEKDHIITVLDAAGGNQSRAAEILGINRKTLYKENPQTQTLSLSRSRKFQTPLRQKAPVDPKNPDIVFLLYFHYVDYPTSSEKGA